MITKPKVENMEARVAATILNDESALANVIGKLAPEDFRSAELAAIYSKACERMNANKPVSAILISQDCHTSLIKKIESLPEPLNHSELDEFSGKIIARSRTRKLFRQIAEIQKQMEASPENPDAILDMIFGIDPSILGGKKRTGSEIANSIRKFIRKPVCERNKEIIKTPWESVNRAMGGGLRPGFLTCFAGKPGYGKSAIALNFVMTCAVRDKIPTVLIDCEMQEEVQDVRLSALGTESSKLDFGYIINNELQESQITEIEELCRSVDSAHLEHWYEPRISVDKICGMVRRFAKQGFRLIIIDYLQKIWLYDRNGRKVPSYEALPEVTDRLKTLALDEGVAILVLSQLTFEGHLKGSKDMEDDFDGLFCLERLNDEKDIEKLYKKLVENRLWAGEIEEFPFNMLFLCKKTRTGNGDKIPVWYDGPKLHFYDIDELRAEEEEQERMHSTMQLREREEKRTGCIQKKWDWQNEQGEICDRENPEIEEIPF